MNKKIIIGGAVAIVVIAVGVCGGIYFFNKSKIENSMTEGNKLMAEKDYKGALKEYEIVTKEDSNNVDAKQMEDIINGYLRAEEYYKNGDLEKAKLAIDSVTGYNKYEIANDIDTLKANINKKEEEAKQKAEKAQEQKVQEQKKAEEQVQNKKVEKQRYLNELDELKSRTEGMVSSPIQSEMNQQTGEEYSLWDDKLNEIWKVLETQLPKSTMDALRVKQNAWIKTKESKKKEIQKEYEGGTLGVAVINSNLAQMTEDRCYYLVNNYM